MENFLQNDKIELRALEPEDLDLLYRIENDPEMWDVSSFSVPYSKYVLKKYIEANQYDVFADRQLRLIIQLKESGETVGTIDISDYSCQHSRGMVGIAVLKDYRTKGIATQALQLLCEYAFRFLHIHQLYAIVAVDNLPSITLFRSCGFSTNGTMKEWLHLDNQWMDVLLMQKLNITSSSETVPKR
jgi:diamine N-acetyltransferase